MATCGMQPDGTSLCYARNDRASLPFNGTVTMSAFDFKGGETAAWTHTKHVTLAKGPGAIAWFTLPKSPNGAKTALLSTVTESSTGEAMSSHMVQLVAPSELEVAKATITLTVAEKANANGSIDIVVASDAVAVFVTLTTLAQGRFSDNCFLLPATKRTVQFIPFLHETASTDMATLKASLRVEDHSAYAL